MRTVIICKLVAVTLWTACAASVADKPKPVPQPIAEDRFEINNLEGWTIYTNRDLRKQHAEQLARTFDHLRWELYQIRLAVPADAVRNMQENNAIWMEYKEKVNLSYHPSRNWLIDRGYKIPRDPQSMMSLSIKSHLGDSYRHPFVVFHELAHGYDYHFIGKGRSYGNKECQTNYERMMKGGKYENVKIWNNQIGSHYARSNRMEYWAESSEAYFAVNDIYPFVRAELREHDSKMTQFVERYWGVNPEEVVNLEKQLAAYIDKQPVTIDSSAKTEYTPTDKYDKRTIKGWTVYVCPELIRQPGLCEEMVILLTYKLHMINHFIAEEGEELLQETPIWLETSMAGPYVRYCGDRAKLKSEGANPDKFGAVEVRDPKRMKQYSMLQQSDMLHELALALYDHHAVEKGWKVTSAYKKAVKDGKYKSVLRFDGRKVPHPAIGNEKLYFAEMMESYFLVNDHYPFIRCELKDQDSAGYSLIADLWKDNPRR